MKSKHLSQIQFSLLKRELGTFDIDSATLRGSLNQCAKDKWDSVDFLAFSTYQVFSCSSAKFILSACDTNR